jgi:uncharacterized membrane protein required for colicin V production
MLFINQYSYLLTSIFVTVLISFFLLRDGVSRRDVIAIASIVGAFVVAWFFIRPTPSRAAQDQIEATLKSGKPTLIEFQSEY